MGYGKRGIHGVVEFVRRFCRLKPLQLAFGLLDHVSRVDDPESQIAAHGQSLATQAENGDDLTALSGRSVVT